MHSLSEFGSNVPAFLAKLWKLVDDPETNELISWTEEGTSFCIRDQSQFSRKLLPMYYKHNNMASFIRQLNMYGFHKIVSADSGSLRLDKDEMEFAHQCFLRGHPYLLEHIKRKVGKSQMLTNKQIEEGKEGSNGGVVVKTEFMNKILTEVKHMRGRQESVESRLSAMKQENEALWRELSLLRQKHIKQQTIVNKLIQFLVTLVQPSQRLSKRRYPLMINSVAHPSDKIHKKVSKLNSNDDVMSPSPSGPTIHELDGDSILPDTDSEILSNTITLHVPVTGLKEVMDTNLEPEVLSPDPEVLDSLSSSIIQEPLTSSLPPIEVNSFEQEVLGEYAPQTSSPSPELLLAVSPSELNPAIVVPGLQRSKAKVSSMATSLPASPKIVTRSASAAASGTAPTIPIVTRTSTGHAAKAVPTASKSAAVSFKAMPSNGITVKSEAAVAQSATKRELRVLPPRNRKKKSSKEPSFSPESEMMKPVDLLAEVDLAGIPSSDSNTPTTQIGGLMNGSTSGIISPHTPSQLVMFPLPDSPIPIVHSPVASPSAPPPNCSMAQSVGMSPTSNTTITDVTSPLIIYPSSSTSAEQGSPQVSPSRGITSPYDMTLACTSQVGSPPTNLSSLKPPYSRCDINGQEDLDVHIGSMDSELGQLKELLNNSGIQLDANTLLGLFSSDDSMHMPEGDGTNFSSKMDPTGNELMYYQPDFMDLEDIWNNDNNRATPPPSPIDILSEVNTPIMMPGSPGFSGPAAKRRRN